MVGLFIRVAWQSRIKRRITRRCIGTLTKALPQLGFLINGAYLIYDRLLCVSDEYLLKAYQHSLSVAKKMQDGVWEKVLRDFLAEYNQKGHLPASEHKQLNDF